MTAGERGRRTRPGEGDAAGAGRTAGGPPRAIRTGWRAACATGLVALALAQAQASPAAVARALPGLEELANEALAETGVPGMAIAVVHRDEVVFLQGFGVREAGGDEPVDADTVFQLASLSKPLASTVVAAVVGEGIVGWDDPVARHDPRFRMHDPWVGRHVTLRDLFAHRSGLPEHAGDLLEDVGYGREAILRRLRHLPPAGPFRASYAYTNFGVTQAAVAAATAAGSTWEDLAEARLYRPLDMTATSSRHEDFLAAPNRAPGHVTRDGRYVLAPVRDPDPQSPAGGVSSSVRDLATWLRLQLAGGRLEDRRVVDAEALAETHRPQVVTTPPADPATDRASFYGLGWNVDYDDEGGVRLSHSGAFALGAATAVYLSPADELGIVVLTNAAPIGVPEAVSLSFLDLVREGEARRDHLAALRPVFRAMMRGAYGGLVDDATRPIDPAPALAAEAYVGRFENDLFGEIEIAARDAGRLELLLGPDREAFELRHYDRDVFAYQPTGENAAGPSGVTFAIGPDRRATSVVIENLDVHGQGTFVRSPKGDAPPSP